MTKKLIAIQVLPEMILDYYATKAHATKIKDTDTDTDTLVDGVDQFFHNCTMQQKKNKVLATCRLLQLPQILRVSIVW